MIGFDSHLLPYLLRRETTASGAPGPAQQSPVSSCPCEAGRATESWAQPDCCTDEPRVATWHVAGRVTLPRIGRKSLRLQRKADRQSGVLFSGLCPLTGANAPWIASWFKLFGPFSGRAEGQVLAGSSLTSWLEGREGKPR